MDFRLPRGTQEVDLVLLPIAILVVLFVLAVVLGSAPR
jgi:hypothetical protein